MTTPPRLGPRWRTSSYSGDSGACVEVRRVGRTIGVRDSTDRTGPVLHFAPAAWTAFATAPPPGRRVNRD